MSWNPLRKSENANLKLSLYDSVSLINKEHWDAVVKNRNIYLSRNYLRALEEAMHDTMQFRYIVFYNKELKPVAVAATQMLNFVDEDSKYHDLLCKVADRITTKILEAAGIKVLICGNVFSCGENGFMFTDDISGKEAYDNLSNGLYKLRQYEKINGKISIVLLKEFWPESFQDSDTLKSYDFRDFMVDVNMVLHIHEDWDNWDDYLNDMTSKFRTKAKSVFKRSEDVLVKNLSIEEIEKYKDEIEELYEHVLEKADFKFGKLNGQAFLNLKRNLHDHFILNGYFLNEKLVGFSSALIFNDIVDANYVGLDYNLNAEYALYQRMLYDFVDIAIKNKASELRLGRTAEEIKSCIGAEPTDMKLYIRHRNSVSNKLLKPIIESISPSEFELRKPFKAHSS